MLDPIEIIKTVGMIGVFLIIFAESGLFFGFFLPGDSLLFAAGLFASTGFFPLWPLVIGCVIAAILGDAIGYATGWKFGPKIFIRENSLLFKRRYLDDARKFYERHGTVTIIVARFIPFVRTFAPIVAGVGRMKYRTFFLFNITGGLLWAVIFIFLGYYIGRKIPHADQYILPIGIVIVLISIIPLLIKFLRKAKPNLPVS